jgi:2-dehydropantoate 2-reductase
MRICVYGAGAIGGNFAARLAEAGNDVSIVARGAHLEAIRTNGLTLLAGDKKIVAKVKASDRPADLGQQDAVLVTLKSSGHHALGEGIAPLLGPDTPVAFVQNGIPWWYGHGLSKDRPPAPDLSRLDPGGALAKSIGMHRVVGAVVSSPNHVIAPGVIENEVPDRNILWVGEPDDRQSPRIEALRTALKGAGIGSPATTDIRYEIWHKLMANLTGSTVCLVTGQPVHVQKTPLVNRLSRRACRGAGRGRGPWREARRSSGRALRPQARLHQPSAVDPAGLRPRPADGDRIDRARPGRLRAQRRHRHADARRHRGDLRGPRPRQGALRALSPR